MTNALTLLDEAMTLWFILERNKGDQTISYLSPLFLENMLSEVDIVMILVKKVIFKTFILAPC